MLKTQFEMHPSISAFPNEYFYNGILMNGENVSSPEYNKEFRNVPIDPYAFMDISLMNESGHTFQSVVAIMVLLESLYKGTPFQEYFIS